MKLYLWHIHSCGLCPLSLASLGHGADPPWFGKCKELVSFEILLKMEGWGEFGSQRECELQPWGLPAVELQNDVRNSSESSPLSSRESQEGLRIPPRSLSQLLNQHWLVLKVIMLLGVIQPREQKSRVTLLLPYNIYRRPMKKMGKDSSLKCVVIGRGNIFNKRMLDLD